MPDTPEDIYRDAAIAMVGAQGHAMRPSTRDVLAVGWWRRPEFRAAVDVGYAAGRQSITDRLVWLDDTTATVDRSVVGG
jgi:hypothetical protein